MNAIKFDLMTLLVLFVVVAIVITMVFQPEEVVEPAVAAPAESASKVSDQQSSHEMLKHFQVSQNMSVSDKLNGWR